MPLVISSAAGVVGLVGGDDIVMEDAEVTGESEVMNSVVQGAGSSREESRGVHARGRGKCRLMSSVVGWFPPGTCDIIRTRDNEHGWRC